MTGQQLTVKKTGNIIGIDKICVLYTLVLDVYRTKNKNAFRQEEDTIWRQRQEKIQIM